MAVSRETRHTINRVAGIIIPAIIIAAGGYSIYVFLFTLCINYLLKPPAPDYASGRPIPKRPAVAIGLLVTYFVLFALTWLADFRFIVTVLYNPGYIPKGKRPSKGRRRSSRGSHTDRGSTKSPPGGLDRQSVLEGTTTCPPGIEEVIAGEVYQCDTWGLPLFCDKCWCWKPNRTHHCSEIGRCVRRMDHFCPWVGGVVGETNMKFFVQFAFYGAIWCAFMLGVMIWACVDSKHRQVGVDGNWYALMIVCIVFFLMAVGISFQNIQFSAINLTTVDDRKLGAGYQYFALQIPLNHPTAYRTITYPLPSQPPGQIQPARFCVVQTQPGQNPWDLGNSMENMKTLMGHHWYEWLLPITSSPFIKEEAFGPVVMALRKQFGLTWHKTEPRRSNQGA